MGADVAQQPGDHGVPDAEGDHRGQRDRAPGGRHGVVGDLGQLVGARPQHGGDRQQERVPRGRLAGVAHGEAGRDRAAGAGDAGDQRQALGETEEHAVRPGQPVEPALGARPRVDEPDDEGEAGQHGHGEPQVAERRLDRVLQQQPQHHDRHRADDDEPPHPGVRVVARQPTDQRPAPRADDAGDVLAEVHEHRRLGAELADRGERRTRVVAAEELPDDRDVRGRGDGQELGEPLHQPEDERLEPAHQAAGPTGAASSTPAASAASRATRSASRRASRVGAMVTTDSVVTPAPA